MIQTDSQVAYIIPADSRDAYFQIIDKIQSLIHTSQSELLVDCSNDPIIIINKEIISKKHFDYMNIKLLACGAKNISDTLL